MKLSFVDIMAWIISIIFHPIIMASFGTLVILFWYPEYQMLHIESKSRFFTTFFVFTYILPLIAIPLYYLIVKITKAEVSKKHIRMFLLLTTAAIYMFTHNVLQDYIMFSVANVYLLLCSSLMLISLVITYFWKISLHMIGIGGFVGLVSAFRFSFNIYDNSLLAFAVILAGTVAASRLQLKAHSSAQVYVGFGLGFLLSFFFLVGMFL